MPPTYGAPSTTYGIWMEAHAHTVQTPRGAKSVSQPSHWRTVQRRGTCNASPTPFGSWTEAHASTAQAPRGARPVS